MERLLFIVAVVIANVEGITAQTRPPGNTTSAVPTPTLFWPTAILPSFPSQFKDIPDSALSCWKSWGDYQLRTQVPNPGIIATPTTSVWWSPLPTPIVENDSREWCSEIISEIPVGLTTLCDGFPRASYIESSYEWTLQTYIRNYTRTDSLTQTVIPGTTVSGYENEPPECVVARNSVPLCDVVNEAYTWWSESRASQTPAPNDASTTADPTPTSSIIETLTPPECIQFVSVPPQAKPTCAVHIDDEAAEIWYWPSALPSGDDFCNSNWTAPTPTPTISGKPNTAVISGLTLTSPTVYQFIKSVTIYTLAGTRRKADNGAIRSTSVWSESTTLGPDTPPHTLLTDARLETDLLSVTRTGPRGAHGAIYFSYNSDFRINDIHTMRSGPYLSNPERKWISTIVQNEVQHSLGVQVPELMRQNGVFGECVWTRTGTRDRWPTEYPVVVHNSIARGSFREIVTGVGTGTGETGPTSTGTVSTPAPPLCRP